MQASEKKIKILLAIKGRVDNSRLLQTLNDLPEFNISLENPRSIKDSLKCLRKNQYDLFICDQSLVNAKLSDQLKEIQTTQYDLPVILITQSVDDSTHQHALAVQAVHSLVIDETDDQGLAQYLNMSLKYSLLNRKYGEYQKLSAKSDSLAGTYSYQASVMPNGELHKEWLSKSFEEVTGYSIEEVSNEGGWISFVNQDDIKVLEDSHNKLFNNEETTFQYRATKKDGQPIWLESHARPEWSTSEHRIVKISGVTKDITKRKDFEEELKRQAAKQQIIATLGQLTRTEPELKKLFDEAVKLITRALDAWLCEIFTIFGVGDKAILRAAAGIETDKIGKLLIPLNKDNELSYTLENNSPTIIQNLKKENKFKPSQHLRKQKVMCGICAPISTSAGSIGVLGVYSNEETSFSEDDINFIQSIANILSSITSQESTEIRLKKTRKVLERSSDGDNDDTDDFLFKTHPDGSDDDISAIVQSALDLHTRDLIMSATAEATKELFQAADLADAIPPILAGLGQALNASRAYLFENQYDLAGSIICREKFEWINQNIQLNHKEYKNKDLDFNKVGLKRFIEVMGQGEYIAADTKDLTEGEQTFLKKRNIQSILLVPIFVDDSWWGFIGFDVQHETHAWATTEIDGLLIAANTLGTAIERNQSDAAFKTIIEATAGKSGKDFFRYLVKHLAQAFQADFCEISEAKDSHIYHIHAIWEVNKFGEPFDCEIAGSPFDKIHNKRITFYTKDVYKEFPKHKWLKEKKIASYIGISIINSSGMKLGHIAIMHTQTINVSERDMDILKVFASRASMEIERLTIERDNQLLARIPLDSVHLIITTDLKGKVTFNNPVCDKLIEDTELSSVNELLPENHEELISNSIEHPGELILAESAVGEFTFQWYYHYHQHMEHIDLYAIDITQRHKLEEQLRQDAFHDPLTELPNRAFFNRLLNHAIDRTNRRNDYRFAVLFLDLDRFKIVNDSLGHAFGDLLLQQVAKVLSDCLRPGDYVARFGGDEFAILLDSIEDAHEAANIAERIQQMLSKPFLLEQNEAFTSASIGIALSEIGYQNAEDIMRDADIAMYSAKQSGKATHVIFDSHMHDEFVHVLKLETDLRRAVKNNELIVNYHPIYSIAEKRVAGFEALVRWQHPERGLLEPFDFIPTAEEMGIIREIDRWVLEVSANQLKDWRNQFKNLEDLKMSINLSAIHFNQMEILAHIGNILKDTELPPKNLKLELTESVVMQTTNLSTEIFNVLSKRGMNISIDDFGVGYSSLNRLTRLPVDTLKIDRSFINSIIMDTNSLNITRAVIDLAHDLGLEVIAEGVETAGQYQILGRMGCQYVQGYYISKPLNTDEATLFIENPPDFL